MNEKLKNLLKLASVASIYAVLTFLTSFISYGGIQFRISECLVLLCFYDKKYIPALVLGCAVANIFSPFGVYDVVFGSFATLLSVIFISKSKNLYIASIFPVVFNGIIVALEILFLDPQVTMNFYAFLVLAAGIMFGEFICVTVLGVSIFKKIEKNKYFIDNIK